MSEIGIGKRIRAMREVNHWKQDELAQAVGVSKQAVSNYESGIRVPKIETLHRLAECLGVSLDYLAKGEYCEPFEQEKPRIRQEERGFPILGDIAAGKPLFAIENIEGYFPGDELRSGEFFFLRVDGDSMRDLRIFNRDLVMIKKQSSAQNGEIVVALINGYETTLKTYKETSDGIWLLPANASYKALFFSNSELESNPEMLQVEGIAVKLLADLV